MSDDELILDDPRLTHDSEARLSSGMKVKEAVERASVWWERKGRKEMRQARLSGNPGAVSFNPNPKNEAEALNSFPSGIMAAKAWIDLSRDEKLRVVKIWHHEFIVKPNMPKIIEIGPVRDNLGVCFYCDQPSIGDERTLTGEYRELCERHFRLGGKVIQ